VREKIEDVVVSVALRDLPRPIGFEKSRSTSPLVWLACRCDVRCDGCWRAG